MIITRLEANNIKKLKAVRLEFDESNNLIMVTGKNAAGKSSVLDSVWYALTSKRNLPDRPIREGEDHAEISLDIKNGEKGTYKVTRTFTPKDSYIKIENIDGSVFSNPSDFLDAVIGDLSFDPAAFSRMEKDKQVAELIRITGADFTELDQRKKDLTEERLFVGREKKKMPVIEEKEYEEAVKFVEENQEKPDLTALLNAKDDAEQAQRNYQSIQASIVTMEESIGDMLRQVESLEAQICLIKKEVATKEATVEDMKKREAPDVSVLEKIKADIASLETISASLANNKAKIADYEEFSQKSADYDKLTAEIEKVDTEKSERLAAAKMPIAGLGWDDDGVTFNGIPYGQLSTAEQLKISMAIAMAGNPKLKVILIRDGSLLDKDSLAVIADIVQQHKNNGEDWQIIIEAVDDSGKTGIYIEDGEVKAIN